MDHKPVLITEYIKRTDSNNFNKNKLWILLLIWNFFVRNLFSRKLRSFSSYLLLIIMLMYNGVFDSDFHLMNLKSCPKTDFFDIEAVNAINNINSFSLEKDLMLLSISKLKSENYSLFMKYLILLAGDINLNPGPVHRDQVLSTNWEVFKKRGLHFLHININSLLPKIDELREIAKESCATVIGISESKLDNTVLDSEISIENYDLVRGDRNRHGGGVACFIRSSICYNIKSNLSSDIENVFIDILLPNSKPITVGIIYRPPNQNNFLELFSEQINNLDLEKNEIYILGDLNYNLHHKGKYIFDILKNAKFDTFSNDISRYIEVCSVIGLKQLIKTPTRITCNTSSLIDHILCNTVDKISQSGVIDLAISDHQLIYCTRKINRLKVNKHTEITS